jgi:hypothetical protein
VGYAFVVKGGCGGFAANGVLEGFVPNAGVGLKAGAGFLVDEGGSLVVKCPNAGFVLVCAVGVVRENPFAPVAGLEYRDFGVVGVVGVRV